jgi:Tfp pilus assembly protein PilF
MRSALQLDPDNPRVQLVECLCLVNSDTDRSTVVFEKLQSMVEAFETSPPSRPGQPDWGHAEALTLLGAQYLQRGDPLAARDALERALVIAPDFREAQNLLQTAATRPQ